VKAAWATLCWMVSINAVDPPGPAPVDRGMPELDTNCDGADLYGGADAERAAWCMAREGKFTNVRTLAEAALERNPVSWRAHTMLGLAHHLGEGNLPKALHHQKEAERLLLEEHTGTLVPLTSEWFVHRITLFELISVHGEMNLHDDQIAYVDTLRDRLKLNYDALKAWPLIKQRRFEEARQVAQAAMAMDGELAYEQREDGRTALCAVESELQHREAAYAACMAAAEPHLADGTEGGVALVNAAVSAGEVLRFDVAERLLLEATRRPVEATINPWGHLSHLYMRQGRLPEAVGALREMFAYRRQRPPHMDQQDQAGADLVGGTLLLLSGRTEEALKITDRTVNRPERLGSSSAALEQHEASNHLMDFMARQEMASRLMEDASVAPWGEAVGLWWRAARLRLEAWMEARQAARLFGAHNMLVTSVRPDCPGSVDIPFWLRGVLTQVLGSGVVQAALVQGREIETLPKERSSPYFNALEAEAAWRDGDHARAAWLAQQVVDEMPSNEQLVVARVAAIGAQAAWQLGQHQDALAFLEVALRHDPGVVRRLGGQVPVRVVASSDDEATAQAVKLLGRSPLFDEQPWGLELQVTPDTLTLALPDGSVVREVDVPAGDDATVDAQARRMARAAHHALMAPPVDITQADVRSLDGAIGSGEAGRRQVDGILDDIMKDHKSR